MAWGVGSAQAIAERNCCKVAQNALQSVSETELFHVTDEELEREINLKRKQGHEYASRLKPIVRHIQYLSKEIFTKNLARPSNLQPTDRSAVRFIIRDQVYILEEFKETLRISVFESKTQKTRTLLDYYDGSINAFTDGNWDADIMEIATQLEASLEPERAREKREKEENHRRYLHQQAKALGIHSPYNFPDPRPAPIPKKLTLPKNFFTVLLFVIVVILFIYVVKGLNLKFKF